MERFVYLMFNIMFFFICIPIILSKAHRNKFIRCGIVGGVAGLISEYWYFKDYWSPPTIIGLGVISPEDFFCGLLDTAFPIVIYNYLFSYQSVKLYKPKYNTFIVCFLVSVTILIILTNITNVNSIILTSYIFILNWIFVIYQRFDLFIPSIVSAGIFTFTVFILYLIIFNIFDPVYWDKYSLVEAGILKIRIFNIMPISELIWHISWGLFISVTYDFMGGRIKVRKNAI